jgi:hypothetical protein
MISKNPKKTFKVVCNSFDTTSYSTVGGSIYNVIFPVNLKTMILNPADLKKAYKLTFSFQSIEDPNIGYSSSYAIFINTNKNINTIQTNNNNRYNKYTGVLKYVSPAGRSINRFLTSPEDNPPVYYDNIEDINFINIRVTNLNNNLTYVPATPGIQPIPNPPIRYWVCVLCFTEV